MNKNKMKIPTADEWKNTLMTDNVCNDTPEDINAFMTVAGAMFFGKNKEKVKQWLGTKYSVGLNTYWKNLLNGNVFSKEDSVVVTCEEKDIEIEYVLLGLLAKGFVTRTIENAKVKRNTTKKSLIHTPLKIVKKKSIKKK